MLLIVKKYLFLLDFPKPSQSASCFNASLSFQTRSHFWPLFLPHPLHATRSHPTDSFPQFIPSFTFSMPRLWFTSTLSLATSWFCYMISLTWISCLCHLLLSLSPNITSQSNIRLPHYLAKEALWISTAEKVESRLLRLASHVLQELTSTSPSRLHPCASSLSPGVLTSRTVCAQASLHPLTNCYVFMFPSPTKIRIFFFKKH